MMKMFFQSYNKKMLSSQDVTKEWTEYTKATSQSRFLLSEPKTLSKRQGFNTKKSRRRHRRMTIRYGRLRKWRSRRSNQKRREPSSSIYVLYQWKVHIQESTWTKSSEFLKRKTKTFAEQWKTSELPET